MQKTAKQVEEINTVGKLGIVPDKLRQILYVITGFTLLGSWILLSALNGSILLKEVVASVIIIVCLLLLKAIRPGYEKDRNRLEQIIIQ
jgi:hypothetical protein